MQETWTRIASAEELRPGLNPLRAQAASVVVGVFGEKLLAFSAFCPHMNGPMARAEVEGTLVSCPLHGWRFDLEDGGREVHGFRCLRMYPVRRVGPEVFIDLSQEQK